MPRYAERTIIRALIATTGWTGATVIRTDRAELVPEPQGIKSACPGMPDVLPAQMPHADAQKAHIARRCGRCTSHDVAPTGSQVPARSIRHSK